MNLQKIIFKTLQIILGLGVFSIVGLLLLGHFGYINTVKPFVVQSGSMEPAIPTGSVVFSFPQSNYQQGDVITFFANGSKKQTVTHRIEFKTYPDGIDKDPVYLTAGDANEELDNWQVTGDQIIGKSSLTVPYLGYAVDFAKKPQGFILLVVVPATIVIYEELKNLLLEIRNIFASFLLKLKKRKNKTHQEIIDVSRTISTPQSVNSKFSLPKAWAILPAIGAGIVIIAFSAGYFFDKENSVGNVFGAAESFGTPTPTLTTTTFEGNPNCTQQGFTFGYKIDVTEMEDGKTYPLDESQGGELIGSAPADSANSITLSNFIFNDDLPPEITHFDWSATLSIDSVLVKAGASGNLYAYSPEEFSDTGLHALINPANNKVFGVSHVEFCYDYE